MKIAPKSKKTTTKPSKKPAVKPPAPPSKPTPELTFAQVQRLKGGQNIDVSKRRFDHIGLHDATYHDCDFTDTILSDMVAGRSSFLRCSFIRTHVCYNMFNRCTFTACDFSDIEATGTLFFGCSFSSMTLSKAFLESALFQSCTFDNCKLPDGVPVSMQRLPTGQFTAYKSVKGSVNRRSKLYVLELLVPRSAERVIGLDALHSRSSNYGKCRVSKAKVVRVLDLGLKDITGLPSTPEKFRSRHDASFTYEVGKWVKPDSFDPNPGTVCSNGIHIFMYPEQAANY